MSSNKRRVFEELIDEVRRSQSATDRFDQAVADALGLGRTDMRCLDVLERQGAVAAGQLARQTGLTSGAMTAAVDRLEASGYVRRVRDEHDRRRVLIELTDRAQDVGGFYAGHASVASELYDNYTTEELQMLLRFVRRGREFNEERAAEVEAENAARASARDAARGGRRRSGQRGG